MQKISIPSLPLAANICEQMLREVTRNERWSMAHVVMNPGAESLLHKHEKMAEVYAITRGVGELLIGNTSYAVQAGSVMVIPPKVPHAFANIGAASLEHLVLAQPAFDPNDVITLDFGKFPPFQAIHRLPEMVECFDGAKIMPYEFPDLDLSFAFGWVINDPARHKKAHWHGTFTEYIYIVEGSGFVEINGKPEAVQAGDWIEVPPKTYHAIRNPHDQYMVALCICSPKFDMNDVRYA